MKLKNNIMTVTLTCVSLLASAAMSNAAAILWNFDAPSAEGWTSVVGDYSLITSGELPIHSGTAYLGDPSDTDADPDTTNIMSSPTIKFDLTSGLTAYLRKGHANTELVQTAGVVSSATTENGFRGIALFDVAANDYVLTTGKTSNSNDWDQVGWTSTQLTNAGVTTTKEYRLHLIDQAAGGWGHINLDTVSFNGTVIPEPSSALLGGLGLLALLRRRR